jgi:hypothetical protein
VHTHKGITKALLFSQEIIKAEWLADQTRRDRLAAKRKRLRSEEMVRLRCRNCRHRRQNLRYGSIPSLLQHRRHFGERLYWLRPRHLRPHRCQECR